MRIHYLQHVPFEGTGYIRPYLVDRGHTLSATRFFLDEPLPETENFDGLIIMGGPMGVHDDGCHPWLRAEKVFIQHSVFRGKWVLGICLGAQLLAHVLGARVYPAAEKEIGWFDVFRAKGNKAMSELLPQKWTTFHWHGDTFDLPSGARLLAGSNVCPNQGFILKERVIGLQFHPEMTPRGADALIVNGGDELVPAPHIQSPKEIRGNVQLFERNNRVMRQILGYLEQLPGAAHGF